MTDTITRLGQKAAVDDEGHVSGWLAPFGGPFAGKDLDGEMFTATTDFALDYYPSLPVLYGHGQDGEVGAAKVGEITLKEIRDQGVWVEGQLDKQSAYYAAIRELADKGDMYWSSGAIAHLVRTDTKTGEIKQWPIAEATLTLTPANPLAEATVKEAEPEPAPVVTTTGTFASGSAYAATSITINGTSAEDITTAINRSAHVLKEGRRNSTADAQRIQSMHDHAVALGAECGAIEGKAAPDADPEPAGKEAPASPAYVLTVVGNDVEQVSQPDLDGLREMLGALAVARAKSLTG